MAIDAGGGSWVSDTIDGPLDPDRAGTEAGRPHPSLSCERDRAECEEQLERGRPMTGGEVASLPEAGSGGIWWPPRPGWPAARREEQAGRCSSC